MDRKEKDAVAFGKRLRTVRMRAGISQADLAEKSGVHRVQIARFETGKQQPVWGTVVALAKALGVSCQEFDQPSRR